MVHVIVARTGLGLLCQTMALLVLIGSRSMLVACHYSGDETLKDDFDGTEGTKVDRVASGATYSTARQPLNYNENPDRELWYKLNRTGWDVSEADKILEEVQDKEATKIGRVSVQLILDYKNMSLHYCQADMMAVRQLHRLDKMASLYLNYPSDRIENFGVHAFAQHHLEQLGRICEKNYDKVLEAAIERLSLEMKEYLGEYANGFGSYLWQLANRQVDFPKPNSELWQALAFTEASCSTLNGLLLFANPKSFVNSDKVTPQNDEKTILGAWHETNKLCKEYLASDNRPGSRQRKAFLLKWLKQQRAF